MAALKQADIRNWVLSGLSPDEFALVASVLEEAPLRVGAILESAGEAAKSVYFVESGIISLVLPLEQGMRIEVGHVGREGVACVHAALGSNMLTCEIVAQGAGAAYRADVPAIRQLIAECQGLRESLAAFANALHVQVAQTAACNGSHEVVQRLARWLLMAHDRMDDDTLSLTHEDISQVLGVTRPGVTIAAGALQKSGLISYSRGKLTVVDRTGLEHSACECYANVADYYESELAYLTRQSGE
ncbi:MAG: helix-turn-helix domain-containing protein [Alphaproteobacteria bacterium]|nr:helix-turn-helix domain-containing protein [Alphaproteobacteria bacterium]